MNKFLKRYDYILKREMKMKKNILGLLICILLISTVSALYQSELEMLDVGHPLRVQEVTSSPENIAPGETGIITLKLINHGKIYLDDIRVRINLPAELKPFNDINVVKLTRLGVLESKDISFKVIALPGASEGIYGANVTIDYTTHFGLDSVNVGEDQQDNFEIGLIIKSFPMVFAEVDSSQIYKGTNAGDITLKFVNYDLADIKFLTVELEESEDYKIISGSKEYIGDLDSDDFETMDVRLKVKKTSADIELPLKMIYKDSINNEYEDKTSVILKFYSEEELGIENNSTTLYFIIAILIIVGIYYGYKKFKKKKRHSINH
jgi:hypothetical protein